MILITPENYANYFAIEKLNPNHHIEGFNGDNANEYTLFLKQDALKHQETHISNTFVLVEIESRAIAAYISLIAELLLCKMKKRQVYCFPIYPLRLCRPSKS